MADHPSPLPHRPGRALSAGDSGAPAPQVVENERPSPLSIGARTMTLWLVEQDWRDLDNAADELHKSLPAFIEDMLLDYLNLEKRGGTPY